MHFDLEKLGLSDDEGEGVNDSEAQFAARSLVEGDASLLMQQYALQYFDADDFREVLDASVGFDSSVLDASPEVVRETLLFTYNAGLQFAVALFQDGGWPAVDAALAAPPVSTEQILHSSHYPDDVPEILALPPLTDTLGAEWRLVDQDVLGEFGLQLYLKAFLEGAEAESAAGGWGGDQYAVYWRVDESAFALAVRLSWDTPDDATEFFDTYRDFATARFGEGPTQREGEARIGWVGDDALLLERTGPNQTLILIAPDETTLEAIYARFGDLSS
jgi:hypothetical protein